MPHVFSIARRSFSIALIAVLSACAAQATQALAVDKATPANVLPPTPTQFNLPDGSALAARVWSHAKPQHIVLGVHGFNDYSKSFEPLARHLVAELQATVYAYDHRGFGANPRAGVWPGSDALVDDLRLIAAQMRERHPDLP